MSYTALYRKWRPRTFEEIVGQAHITATLKNQIKNNSIAHAYLFCGTRGTGKTSTAKVFARAINCLSPEDNNPCNKCEICTGILNESLMDVIEIDAASNNGVDNIREIRENVKYPPSKTKYKVYIIDEVHMLSQGAFNALLKTLEEPPGYVIFILATTEPHKIPATIHSRCQRFDFKRVTFEEIFNRLKNICNSMGIEVEDKALRLIVGNSDGAVRDALSLLDQCISFSEEKLTYEKVVEVLGLVTDEFLFKLTDAIYEEDSRRCMELIDSLINSGKDVNQFIKDFIRHLRNLMMTKMTQRPEEVIDMSNENIERLKEQGKKFEINTLIRFVNLLSQAESEIKWSSQPRILLELAVIKLLQPRLDESYEGLMDRINRLEKKIQGVKYAESPKGSLEEKKENKEQGDKEVIELESNEKNEESEIDSKENEDTPRKKLDFEDINSKWKEILKEIKKIRPTTHAALMEGKPVELEGNKLVISFREGYWFHKDASNKKNNRELIEKCIFDKTGQKVRIKCVMEDEIKEFNEGKGELAVSYDEKKEEIEKIKEFFAGYEDKLEIIE